jgi:putative membrane protein
MSNAAHAPASRLSDRTFYVLTGVVSAAALALLAWLLLIRRGGGGEAQVDLRFMPAVNASLNAAAASLLLAGWVAIKRGARRVHQYLMVATFVASALFLVGYLAYHYVHGDTRYAGDGVMRTVYLVVLASHVLLSMPVVPLALVAFYLAWRQDFRRHRKVTRWLAPIWLYVSVTGVVVYFMLRGSLPASP